MRFLSAAHTDVGISKKINQDAFCLKIARTPKHNIAFMVMCDGMGGLKHGELASAWVVNAFSAWFENELPTAPVDFAKIKQRFNEITLEMGRKILSYGTSNGISLGTTLTALLVVDNQFLCVHVGDSRLYKLSTGIEQLTRDHTLVAYEVEQKKITLDEAKVDSRKNILLQCVGASKVITPDFVSGTVNVGDTFLICSDGFRHEISEEEIFGVAAPALLTSETVMKKSLVDLIELNKTREERDNITALLLKAIR